VTAPTQAAAGAAQPVDRSRGSVRRRRYPEREGQLGRLPDRGDEDPCGNDVTPGRTAVGQVRQGQTGPTGEGRTRREVEAEVGGPGRDEGGQSGRDSSFLAPPEADEGIGHRTHDLPGEE
jgi:hypothetical protein